MFQQISDFGVDECLQDEQFREGVCFHYSRGGGNGLVNLCRSTNGVKGVGGVGSRGEASALPLSPMMIQQTRTEGSRPRRRRRKARGEWLRRVANVVALAATAAGIPAAAAGQQSAAVSGRILDRDGAPVPTATVSVSGAAGNRVG